MNIAISNIAWDIKDDDRVLKIVSEKNVTGIEVAPTKLCPDIVNANFDLLRKYRENTEKLGITIIAMQSILYGRNDLQLFDTEEGRTNTLKYLRKIVDIGETLGARVLVFGSPKNRDVKNLSFNKACEIAIPFFRNIGDYCKEKNIKLCIEPNAKEYNCNFLRRTNETAKLVREINNNGIGLHLDSGIMHMNGEDIENEISTNIDIIEHFHISEPFLKEVHKPQVNHKLFADSLKKNHYSKWCSIEMLPQEKGIDAIAQALDFAIHVYSS